MGYKNSSHFNHDQADKVGLIITNLGTPKAPKTTELRTYLRQFLSDPRVVEFPRLLWWLILNLIILRIRPSRSAKAYQSVWTEQGSPLAIYTEKQAKALEQALKKEWGDTLVVDWAMRYGEPSVEQCIQKMMERGVRKLLVMPLYPQYSGSTVGSTFDALASDFTTRRWIPELRFITHYHDFPPYIDALANSIKEYWNEHGRPQKIIFSYHGVPLRYLHNGDPYHCQCHKTSRLLADALEITKDEYLTTFQSRFGREPWLQPYTDHTLESLPGKGIKSIQVVCPGFSADCLETIEEIGMENRDIFMEAGGEQFAYIPALNDSKQHINALQALAQKHLQGWEPHQQDDIPARAEAAMHHPHNQKT